MSPASVTRGLETGPLGAAVSTACGYGVGSITAWPTDAAGRGRIRGSWGPSCAWTHATHRARRSRIGRVLRCMVEPRRPATGTPSESGGTPFRHDPEDLAPACGTAACGDHTAGDPIPGEPRIIHETKPEFNGIRTSWTYFHLHTCVRTRSRARPRGGAHRASTPPRRQAAPCSQGNSLRPIQPWRTRSRWMGRRSPKRSMSDSGSVSNVRR